MTDQKVADYGETVDPKTYISGIRVHPWLATMYEIMARRVVAEVAKRAPKGTVRIYDLGCGPGHFVGLLAQRLAELGYEHSSVIIIGYDISPRFLAWAGGTYINIMRRAPWVDFVEADVTTLKAPPADIIVTSGFFHHFDPTMRPALFDTIGSLLKDDGVLIDGDEHIPSTELVDGLIHKPSDMEREKWQRKLALCFLYLQVIHGASVAGHEELKKAETENLLSELYRDDPQGVPLVREEEIGSLLEDASLAFVCELAVGFNPAREAAYGLLHQLDAMPRSSDASLIDRQDRKVTVDEFTDEMRDNGFICTSSYDTYLPCDLFGGAPVLVFEKSQK